MSEVKQHRPIVLGRRLENEYGIPYSRQHRDRLTKSGKFPRKIQLGGRCVAYYRDEIEAWLTSRPTVGARPSENGR
jgi:predicted DNA-binding transcriptional regulator AlpA